MKKIYIIPLIVFILICIGVGVYLYNKNNKSNNSNSNLNTIPYNSTRVSTTNDTSNVNTQNGLQPNNDLPDESSKNEDVTQGNSSTENTSNPSNENPASENTEQAPSSETKPQETEIASFTTKIYTKDSDRQTNMSITCSSLNDTTVENGKTFSFCNTVGKATSAKGYKKADVFKDGEKVEALGRWKLPGKFYII